MLFECRCFPLLNQKRCTKVSSYLTQTQVLLPLVCFWERMLCSLFPKVCEKLSLLRRTRSCVCSLCPFFKTHLPLHVIACASSLLLLVALWGGWSLLQTLSIRVQSAIQLHSAEDQAHKLSFCLRNHKSSFPPVLRVSIAWTDIFLGQCYFVMNCLVCC